MKKHRGLISVLGLAALIGLMAREGRAETITMTISTNGHVIPITGALVNGVPTPQSFQVNTVNLNNVLAADGSAYRFTALGANSNWAGSTGSDGGFLSTGGNLVVSTTSTGVTGTLTITTTEDGFTAPTGTNGTLKSTQNAAFNSTAAGDNQSYVSSFNGTTLPPPLVSTSTGPIANNYSPSRTDPIGAVAAGYSLDNHLTFNLTQNTASQASDNGFQGTAQVFASSVPEPASMILMLTGMPLPLVVMGLLRRRRAAA